MIKPLTWREMNVDIEEKQRISDHFDRFRANSDLLIGSVVKIEGYELEFAGEKFIDELEKEARRLNGKSKIKTIKARALMALSKQIKNNLIRMGYDI